MPTVSPSPPSSPPSTGLKRRHSPSLSLDFSDLPPLTTPSAPSNTLIITNLADPSIFSAPNLASIRTAISAEAALHSFSPLKSFRRIIATFRSTEDAVHVRSLLDGESVLGQRVRVYFGEPTSLEEKERHLPLPETGKLFFISPPPSPPVGWESKREDAPNKEVHADDLVSALHRLNASRQRRDDDDTPPSPASLRSGGAGVGGRSRSSTLVFDPAGMGGSPGLPAIAVEDTSEELSEVETKGVGRETKAFAPTSRPPVELMG